MALRTLRVELEPIGRLPRGSPDAGIAGTYSVEVDASLSSEDARQAALEAVREAVDIEDPGRFSFKVL